jgi:hypothetical protein
MALLPANIISDLGSGQNILTTTLSGLGILPPQWGIFNQSGKAVVVADTVMSIEHRKDWNVSDYQQERGAFASYNKVAEPFDARIQFASGGSLANRRKMLASIRAIQDDLKIYDVVTPDETYLSVNINHVDLRRADGKVGIIVVNVHVIEIRQTAESALGSSGTKPITNGADSGNTDPVNGGQVQTSPPTAAQQTVISKTVVVNNT